MKVIDPGHRYLLDSLDGDGEPVELHFVKRVGDRFPGNEAPGYGGPTTQEVLRVLIDRTKYVDGQIGSVSNEVAIEAMRAALIAFEQRAARERGEESSFNALMYLTEISVPIEDMPTCPWCGHVGCGRPHQF